MICKLCAKEFKLLANHSGYANVCPECSEGDEDTPRLMAKVAWSGKHQMEMEITSDRDAAKNFNNAQKRIGAGVTRSLTSPKESPGQPGEKRGSGAEAGAVYSTRLGEKRSVKW